MADKSKKSRKGGVESAYDPRQHPALAKWMTRSGMGEAEIAAEFGIGQTTFERWKADHPELRAAVVENRYFVDALVEESLLKRALGYDYVEVHRKQAFATTGADGEPAAEPPLDSNVDMIERRVLNKHMPPDVGACQFWLKNRQPEQWRDVQKHEHTGKVEHAVKNRKRVVQRVLKDPQAIRLANELMRRAAVLRPSGN